MSIDSITISRWFEGHLHPRKREMAVNVFPHTIKQCATGAVIMGNHPDGEETSTLEKTLQYRRELEHILPIGSDFKLSMTCYLTDEITPEEVVYGFKQRIWTGVKLYMANKEGKGGTSHSQKGVRNLLGRYPVFAEMQHIKAPLLGHFEATEEEVDEFDREWVSFNRDVVPILNAFPKLPVIIEHITDGRVADFVGLGFYPNLYATVTAHHLMINRNAMFWGGMNPLNYCRPVPKREWDRLTIRQHVTSGNKRFRAGTDSAPWVEEKKALPCGCAAGIFTAPCAAELYATVFDEDNALQNYGPFMSKNFIELYGMEESKETMTLERRPFVIPERVGKVRVFKGGQTLPWTLVG